MNKEKALKVIGYVLFVFWLVFTAVQFLRGEYTGPLWFCNFTVALLAIACFQRSLNLFYFFLAMGLFFQTPWIIDWAVYLTSGFSFFDLGSMYGGEPFYSLVLTFMRHTLTVPLVFVLLFLFEPKKPSKRAVYLWMGGIIGVMVISYFVGGIRNINCAKAFCSGAFGYLAGVWYSIIWVLIIMAVSLFSLYFVIMPIHRFIVKIKFV